MKSSLLVLFFCFGISNLALAHGEDKFGPNGGFVRMPGAFHTEVVQQGKNSIKVYLLDIEWKNPSIIRSDVKAVFNGRDTAICKADTNFYLCTFSKSVNLNKKGEIKLQAHREDKVGAEAVYKTPLKLESAEEKPMDHSSHH